MLDSGLGEFFRQLPPILIIMFCGSSIALIVVLAVIVNTRSKRSRAAATAAPVMSMSLGEMPPSGSHSSGDGELPDLDDLLSVAPAPAPKPAAQRGTRTIHTSAGESIEVVEVMTILRDIAEGGLIVQIGDKTFRNPPALADAEFKRRFNSTVRDLYQSIGDTSLNKKATSEIPGEIPPSPSDGVTPPPPPVPRPAPPFPPPASPRPAPTTSQNVPLPGDLPRFKMPDEPEKPKRGRRQPSAPIPEINIAEAIEEFLQFKLTTTPEFAGRNIHVRPAFGGGLRIDVDDSSYETVSEVDDASVRAFLQATIEEWQSRQ